VLDFISYNRFNTFIDRILTVRKTATSTSYIDNSANDLFTGPSGTILQKQGNIFSYKYPTDSDFTIINYANNSIEALCNKYSVLLTSGVNKNVTWVKLDNSPGKKWENRGVKCQSYIVCEIVPCTPTPTPYSYYCCGDLGSSVTIGTLKVTKLIVDSNTNCPPTTAGTRGQVAICENYLYIYDGVEWKRFEISNYY
jgi:hypothetical protein